MPKDNKILKELVKRGYTKKKNQHTWDISDSRFWYLTPELSKGFLNLANYKPYKKVVIDRELLLIKRHTQKIVKFFGHKKFNLIDLGCGNGVKTREFIRHLPKDIRIRYYPIDISSYFIETSVARINSLNSNKVVYIKPFLVDFEEFNEISSILRNNEYQHNLTLLLGETISHYQINEFLFQITQDMLPGDVVVIGNGYRKGKRFVHIEKYKDPIFNDWFIYLMRGLGFKDNEVRYDARFANGRLELFYHILVDKTIKYKGKQIYFRKNDKVIIGAQYKYYPEELQKFCKMYFSEVLFLPDKVGEYCLLVCRK